jgi:hypothetical protein
MSRRPRVVLYVMSIAVVVLIAAPATTSAQGDPDTARFRIGSFALTPVIRLTNVGRDSNVYNNSDDEQRQSDITAAASPIVEAWYRTPRLRLSGRSEVNMFYYRELTPLRAVDRDHSGRAEVVLDRVMPWVSGALATTRHRQNLEIDAFTQRRNDDLRAGADVRLTRKTSVGIYGGQSHVEFEPDALFRGTDLARSLNHKGTFEGLAVRYAATPLTTFAVNVDQGRDRFAFSPERNSDNFRVAPSVEFKPLALISGRAAIGFHRVSFRQSGQPDYKSTAASIDLQYTLRSRTQFSIRAQRDLEYSYIDTQIDYVLAGFTTSVTQRFADRWDAVVTGGRYGLNYRRQPLGGFTYPNERVLLAGSSVGYFIGRNRVSFDIDYQSRQSDLAITRGYHRLRVGSSLSYVF